MYGFTGRDELRTRQPKFQMSAFISQGAPMRTSGDRRATGWIKPAHWRDTVFAVDEFIRRARKGACHNSPAPKSISLYVVLNRSIISMSFSVSCSSQPSPDIMMLSPLISETRQFTFPNTDR